MRVMLSNARSWTRILWRRHARECGINRRPALTEMIRTHGAVPFKRPKTGKNLPRLPETDYKFDGWALPNPPSHNDEYSTVDGTSWKYRTIGIENFLVRLVLTDASIWGMAEQMLGKGSLAVPTRTRGIYCRFPQRDIPVQPLKPHLHAFHRGTSRVRSTHD